MIEEALPLVFCGGIAYRDSLMPFHELLGVAYPYVLLESCQDILVSQQATDGLGVLTVGQVMNHVREVVVHDIEVKS